MHVQYYGTHKLAHHVLCMRLSSGHWRQMQKGRTLRYMALNGVRNLQPIYTLYSVAFINSHALSK